MQRPCHTNWNTYLHELGHALGLRHPNEAPGDDTTNDQFTVMSYVAHPEEVYEHLSDQTRSLTPMVWDMQAIQMLYGTDTTTRTGDTVYFGDGGSSAGSLEYQYAADGMMVRGENGTYRDVILTIWDAGGTDLIDASDLSTDSRIDLRPGHYSAIGSIDNNIAVAAAVQDGGTVINYIENAWAGFDNDRLTGNDTHNQLMGKDRLMGGRGNGGADTFVFGQGRDTVTGFNANNSAEDIDLRNSGEITGYNDLMVNHVSSVSGGVLIDDLNGNTMLLEGVSLGTLGRMTSCSKPRPDRQ